MVGIAKDRVPIVCENFQLRVVGAQVDVEARNIIRRLLVPKLRVIGDIVSIANYRGLSVLRRQLPVNVEAIEPHSCPIEHFSSMLLVLRLCCVREVQVEIGSNTAVE